MIGVHSVQTWTTFSGGVHQRTARTQATDSQLALAERFISTLLNGVDAVDPKVAERAAGVLRQIRSRNPALSMPTISPSQSGAIGMTWEARGYHANVQVFQKRVEYFVEAIDTGTLWSMEVLAADVPVDFFERLGQIVE